LRALLGAVIVARQAIVRNLLPSGGEGDELPILRPNSGITVEGAETHAVDLVGCRVRAEEVGATTRAKDLPETVGRLEAAQQLLALDHPHRARHDSRLGRRGGPGATLATSAMAVAGGHGGRVDLEA